MKQNDIEIRRKYMAEKSKRLELRFWIGKDDDILAYFDTMDSRERTSVIKEALRDKMIKDGFKR